MRLFGITLWIALTAGAMCAQEPCSAGRTSVPLPVQGAGYGLEGVHVGGGPRRMVQIDTGSTGLVIGYMHIGGTPVPLSAKELEQFQLAPDHIAYNSSGNVPVGTWVWTSVKVAGAKPVIIPRVPVLSVRRMCQALPDGTTPEPACLALPPVPNACGDAPDQATVAVCELGMMGVGFNRGPSMGTWQVNPFLNAQPMLDGTMQRGYIVTGQGVRLGITERDLEGFELLPLTRIAAPYEWRQASGCVAITGGGVAEPGKPVCGNILIDTGVDKMFVSYATAAAPAFEPPLSLPVDLWSCPRPLAKPPTRACTSVRAPVSVRVTWPNAASPVMEYSVSTPSRFSPAGVTPSQLHVRATSSLPEPGAQVFVNTGRQFLQTADYLYDATCGRIGFRRPPANRRR